MKIHVFTDGSSRGNPGPGGWGSVVVTDSAVRELGGAEADTTNNRMELRACIGALQHVRGLGVVANCLVYSDSKYVIQGIESWVHGWVKNGWVTKKDEPVVNQDLWQELYELTQDLDVSWKYVGGHIGIPGNERCDVIATSFADGVDPNLYKGSIEGYPVKNILQFDGETVKQEKKNTRKGAAYSYLSLVGGVLVKHKTWADCESRVKGTKGAKFKKALSASDEKEIAASWGVRI